MKSTITTEQIIRKLMADNYANWSYNGAKTIADYLQELECDLGYEIEFDRVAIRCEFSEYASALEAVENCDRGEYQNIISENDTEDQEAAALEWLQEKTIVIEFDGGIIVQQY